jgi:hypothetical protein
MLSDVAWTTFPRSSWSAKKVTQANVQTRQSICEMGTEDPRFYKPIPEYEGAHRWDPDFEWTEQEERAVVAWTTFPRSSWSAKKVTQANVQTRQSICEMGQLLYGRPWHDHERL